MTKTALITGVTGQDGAYLAEFLLNKGYIVHGIKRRSSSINTDRIDHIYQEPHTENKNFFLHYGDMTDGMNLIHIINETKPDEIYNLAAMSHVKVSFDTPEYTANTNGLGTLRLLEAIRILKMQEKVRFYQASSSELYGLVQQTPQKETTPFYPRSPYAVAKLYAHWITINYREAYNIFASNGILFNHESPIRGETFVTKKITNAVARIALGLQDKLYLGNLDAQRDWGHAKDYVRAMWMILQADKPDDWVVASGITSSVREFAMKAFAHLGVIIEFTGSGLHEKGIIHSCSNPKYKLAKGTEIINIDPRYYRPSEVDILSGDSTKARTQLGWKPKYDLGMMIAEMVDEDLKYARQEKYLSACQHINQNIPEISNHEEMFKNLYCRA